MLQATACVRLPATRSPVWPIHFFANQGILMFPSSGSFYTRRLAGSRSSCFLAMFRCRLLSLESSLDSSMHNRKLMLLASASACCDLRFTIRHADWPLCPHIIRSNILEAFVFFLPARNLKAKTKNSCYNPNDNWGVLIGLKHPSNWGRLSYREHCIKRAPYSMLCIEFNYNWEIHICNIVWYVIQVPWKRKENKTSSVDTFYKLFWSTS